jgi:multimeric flavodoxin WrbA
MSKKVLVITGSARFGGNSDLMADAFIKGAQAAGNTVTKVEAAKLKLTPCKACNTCYSKGVACSFQDDFNQIAPLIEEADVIAFATPLYWSSYPAQLKMVIDKFYSLIIGQKKLENKGGCLLLCGEDTDASVYSGLLGSYTSMADFLKWSDLGQLVMKGVNEKGQIKDTDGLLKAEELGRNIA